MRRTALSVSWLANAGQLFSLSWLADAGHLGEIWKSGDEFIHPAFAPGTRFNWVARIRGP